MTPTHATATAIAAGEPWQLQMLRRALKKQLKLRALFKVLGDVAGQRCLLITCGDNNGAMNWHFRARGGNWVWGDLASESLREMAELLGEPVLQLPEDHLPFPDRQFDCVVVLDVLEHLADDQVLLREVRRVLRPAGRAIVTVPNGDPGLLANQLRWKIGMTPDVYGHTRAGYTLSELADAVERGGLRPAASGGYSRLFTELVEMAVNFAYVFVLARKRRTAPGQIAPTTSGDLKQHGGAYRLYTAAFPVLRIISGLDRLLPADANYAVIIEGIAPAE